MATPRKNDKKKKSAKNTKAKKSIFSTMRTIAKQTKKKVDKIKKKR